MRTLHAAGKLIAIAEIGTQYSGIMPDDPRLEPYYALAEELDVPIGLHTGPGGMRGNGDLTWTALAHRFGYFDQAHLLRDAHAFTGMPPSALVLDSATMSDPS